jgi:hypothetical protein
MTTFPVRVVFSHRRSSPAERSMSLLSAPRPVVDAADEEVSELGISGASSSLTPALEDIKQVWEFAKVDKLGGPDDFSKRWHCGWCGSTFKGWNATKVMVHLARVPGNNDVKACSGPISKEMLALFRGFRLRKTSKKSVKRKKEEAYQSSVSENQKSMAVAWQGARIRSSASSGAGSSAIDVDDGDQGDVSVSNAAKLTTAIAEFVYCQGLSFSATEGQHFLQILKLSSLVPSSYRPPTRRVLANELLEISYQNRLDRYMVDLAVESEVYGLSLFGDGATVHGMPLMNILASGVGEPCAVLSIVDCKFCFSVTNFPILTSALTKIVVAVSCFTHRY